MSPDPFSIAVVHADCSPQALIGLVSLAKALAHRGHRVDILTRRQDASSGRVDSPAPGVRVLRLDVGRPEPIDDATLMRLVPAFVERAGDILAHEGPYDMVHAHRVLSALVAQRLKECHGIPYVASFDPLGMVSSAEHLRGDAIAHLRVDIERRVMSHADRLIAECPQQCQDLRRLYGVNGERISLVAPCVDAELFKPRPREATRAELGLAASDFVVLQAGTVTPHKGVDNAIRALGRLGGSSPARLFVAGSMAPGDAGEPARLAALASQSGVAERVTFLGRLGQSELALWLASADVVVDTPWFEPLGKSPLEAMASGTPVIASDVGGTSHTVLDGVSGFLVRPRDPIGLATRIAQLQSDPSLARTLGRAGALRAQSIFGVGHMAKQLNDAYHLAREQAHAGLNQSWVPESLTESSDAELATTF